MDLMDLTSSSDEEEPDPGEFMLHNQYNCITYFVLAAEQHKKMGLFSMGTQKITNVCNTFLL